MHEQSRAKGRALLGVVLLAPAIAAADPVVHGEVDPLPFVNRGYGGQVGVRAGHVRVAIASFALDVPGPVAELGGNDGFALRVRPSGAFYALYFLRPGRDGLALGGSLRYLRLRYERAGDRIQVVEVSPEVIVGYQWHPFDGVFYLQPWFALGVTAWRDREPIAGGRTYDTLPVSPFFTINLGWELTP